MVDSFSGGVEIKEGSTFTTTPRPLPEGFLMCHRRRVLQRAAGHNDVMQIVFGARDVQSPDVACFGPETSRVKRASQIIAIALRFVPEMCCHTLGFLLALKSCLSRTLVGRACPALV